MKLEAMNKYINNKKFRIKCFVLCLWVFYRHFQKADYHNHWKRDVNSSTNFSQPFALYEPHICQAVLNRGFLILLLATCQ